MQTKFIRVEKGIGGKTKFSFFQLDVFKFLHEEMGYSYIRIKGKGKYIKSTAGGYEIVRFQELRDDFTEYLRNDFDYNLLPEDISWEDFMNKYYQKNPITQPYARAYFSSIDILNEITLARKQK
ncbi:MULTISPECIES: hypothetical protein [unclassified Maribacter]|uniref:hypothetical protein n=1 Tax=unclassified Maribacter TaxID=2615042 RepID=UPI002580D5B7|nr:MULTISPECIES: hypothetical protein [unclassified Maribacter]|tara:strand:+ start:706 stop:1077 length:372 start_codon:yes stop_codon:yes gene_type:complete